MLWDMWGVDWVSKGVCLGHFGRARSLVHSEFVLTGVCF